MTYHGRLSLSALRADHVHPGRFETWDECRAYFNRYASDRKTVFQYGRWMSGGDAIEPIRLAVARDSGAVFVDDGQHRVLAAMDVNLPWLAFRWVWLGSRVVQNVPLPEDVVRRIYDQ
jgi:hypothetical protein